MGTTEQAACRSWKACPSKRVVEYGFEDGLPSFSHASAMLRHPRKEAKLQSVTVTEWEKVVQANRKWIHATKGTFDSSGVVFKTTLHYPTGSGRGLFTFDPSGAGWAKLKFISRYGLSL